MPLRAAAICGLLAPITFIAGWLIGGLAQPAEYSVVDHDISDLGAVVVQPARRKLGPRVATTILFAWVALVSYRLLRIAQEPTVASSAAPVDI